MIRFPSLPALAAVLCASAAQAHVSVDPPQAVTGTTVKAALRVTHGCEGTATHTVQLRIPDGLRGAKPMPKAGWTLSIRKAPLAQPYESHGRTISEDTVEVTWTARSRDDALPDWAYNEFVVRGQVIASAGPLWFAVRQVCEKGSWDWSERPASGTSTRGLKAPAAAMEVLPAPSATPAAPTAPAASAAGGHHHH